MYVSLKTDKGVVMTPEKEVKRKRGAQPGNQNAKKRKNRKGGAPKGNQNAKGGRGNPHPKKPLKHGCYSVIYLDELSKEEKEILDSFPTDPEVILWDTIRLYHVLEHRLMKKASFCYEHFEETYESRKIETEHMRVFKNKTEQRKYEKLRKKKIKSGELLPGDVVHESITNKSLRELIPELEKSITQLQKIMIDALVAVCKVDEGNRLGLTEKELVEVLRMAADKVEKSKIVKENGNRFSGKTDGK